MSEINEVHESNRGYFYSCILKNFPVAFVNAIRRILLSEIPTVVLTDIRILENTTQLPHEMLKHRFSMLPINIHPSEVSLI